jgi:peptide/nickel transport system substrate-binding protein
VLLCGLLLGGAAGAASPPGILVVVQALDDIVSLDPAEGFELSSVQTFTSVYQRLVQPDPEHPAVLRPTLASGWTVGPDGRSLLFELRPGARFASGNPVRPEDVVYSLARAVRMNRAPAFILNELGWEPGNVDRYLEKVDAGHVRLRWPAPVGSAFALNVLTAAVASIVDEALVARAAPGPDAGNAWLHTHSAGSGPFRIRRYVVHEALVLDANPLAPGGGPLLKTVVIKNVADAASRRLLVEVGDADIARDLGPDQVAALAGKAGLRTLDVPSATLHYLLFNAANAANPVLRNPALWEAARWLVDYDGIARDLLKGQYAVHQAFLADGFPGALNATPYHLDVAKATAILAKAGIPRGTTIRLDVFNQPPYVDIAQSLQATFAKAGIRLEILPSVASAVYARTRTRAEEAVWLYWVPDYFDPHSTAGAFALNRGDAAHTVAWRAGWEIPKLSADTLAAVAEQDPAARARLYGAIQAEVQRSSPYVFALQARTLVVMRANVTGYRQGLNADMIYYDRVSK